MSRGWRRIEGVVTESAVVPHRVRLSGEGWGSRIYRPLIRYRYVVDGCEYTSDRIFYGRAIGQPRRAPLDDLVRRYPVGTTARVYVNPNDPANGLLEPGARIDLYATMAVFTGTLLVGLSLLLGLWS